MKHMNLEEWDKTIGPKLGAIKVRATWIKVDANQILDWVKSLSATPDFETEAFSDLVDAKVALACATEALQEAISKYEMKEKVS